MSDTSSERQYIALDTRYFDLYAKLRSPGPGGLYSHVVWQRCNITVRHTGPVSTALFRALFDATFGPGASGIIVDGDHAYRFYGNSFRPVRNWQRSIEDLPVYERESK